MSKEFLYIFFVICYQNYTHDEPRVEVVEKNKVSRVTWHEKKFIVICKFDQEKEKPSVQKNLITVAYTKGLHV